MDCLPFQKTLTDTDVTKKFTVPNEWLGTLLPDLGPDSQAPNRVRDAKTGSEYTFTLRTRRVAPEKKPYKKPVFQARQWLEFAGRKRLRANEIIYFWPEGDRRDNMKINVQVGGAPPRLYKLFGGIFQLYN